MKPSRHLMAQLTATVERYAGSLTPAWATYLEGRGIPSNVATEACIGTVTDPAVGHERFTGMLSIPYMTKAGCVGVKFRRWPGTDGAKYDAPAGQKTHMFNVNNLHTPSPVIAVCEGELDTLVASQILPAVGVAGVNNWKPWFGRCLEGFERVLILADNDRKEDGTNPGMELGKRIVSELPQATIVSLPPGVDVSELVQAQGLDALRALVER